MLDDTGELELSEPQARVLGALMEKQATTPESYPLTLNALVSACNQSSNRDPVVVYGAGLVENTIHALKGKGLARIVHPGRGERATKFRHVADEALGIDPAQRALLCVLLLRGPQTVSELRTRTERLHPFADRESLEVCLDVLARRSPPLVVRLDRLAGQKEPRWRELLRRAEPSTSTPARVATSPSAPLAGAAPPAETTHSTPPQLHDPRLDQLVARVDRIERELRQLRAALGEADPHDRPAGGQPTDT